MRLQAEEDVVDGPDLGWVVRCMRIGHEVTTRTKHAHTVFPHRVQVVLPRDEVHVGTTTLHCGAPVGTDRSRTDHCNPHGDSLRSHTVCNSSPGV